jgi:hypothetical protein
MFKFFKSRSTNEGNKRGHDLDARPVEDASQMLAQSGFERFQFQTDRILSEAKAMNNVENFFALCFALNGVTDTRQAAAVLFLYVKTHYTESVLQTVKDYLVESQLFTTRDFDSVASSNSSSANSYDADDEFEVQAGAEHWLNSLKDIKENWNAVVKSPAFSKISKLLSMCASLGLCNLTKFNVDVQGIRVFSIPAYGKHVCATDFISACFDTVEYFINGGYECFKSGSITPLLYEDKAAQEFESEFFKVRELANSVKCGNLEKLTGMKDNDYGALLDSLIERADRYLKELPQSWERKIMSSRREQLAYLRMDYITYRISGKQREAPYGLFIHGKPGVGKSYTMNLLTRVVLTSNGYDASDDRIVVINEADKFMSNIKAHVNAILIDDMGNTKDKFVEKSPAQKIIELINNVQYYANMADVDQKGKISLEPKVVCVSSNLTMQRIAQTYSNDSMSIMRRVLHIQQYVRPYYKVFGTDVVDTAKVMRDFGDDPFPDIYLFDVKRAKIVHGKPDLEFVPGLNPGCSLASLTKWLIEDSRQHFSHQTFLIEHNQDMVQKLNVCNGCHCPEKFCTCYHKEADDVSIDMDAVEQFLDAEEESVDSPPLDNQAGFTGNSFMDGWSAFAQDQRTGRHGDANMALDHNWVMRLFIYLPDCMFNNWVIQYIYFICSLRSIAKKLYEERAIWCYIFMIVGYCLFLNIFLGICGATVLIYIFLIECWKIHKNLCMARANEPGQMRNMIYVIQRDKRMKLLGSCALLALFYKIITYAFTAYKLSAQGSLSPETAEDVQKRDAEANPWIGAFVEKVPQTLDVRCTAEQLSGKGSKNLVYMRMPEHPDGVAVSDAFFIDSQKVLMNDHMVYDDKEIYVELYGAKAFDSFLGEFAKKPICKLRLSLAESELIGKDFRLFHVHNGKTWANQLKFFAEKTVSRSAARLVYRNGEGDVLQQSVQCHYKHSMTVGGRTMPVYMYNTLQPTFKGMCMSMLVSDTNPSVILGFHLGGKGNVGAAGCVTRGELQIATEAIHARNPHLLIAHSGGEFVPEVYGKTIITSESVHEKSFFNHLPVDNSIDVFGSTFGRAKATTSKVIKTEISDTVAEVCGVPNIFGKPKFHRWKNYWENLQKLQTPSEGFPAESVAWACRDYIAPLLEIIQKPMWKEDVKPATWMQTICGRDGVRFFGKMPPNTSIGFPLSGAKKNHMIALDPEQFPDFQCPMDMEPEFKEEVERLKQVYLRGERAYPIFKAALKDEPTKVTKDKVRVFFAAPFALQALVRQYFLPVARFIFMNPIVSECAVGVNSLGPEWDELVRHITEHGEDRILAGDYSDFDTKIPAQITAAAYNLFIQLAKATGNYSEDEIKIMRGIATDCTHPMIAYDGVLMMLAWLHASGINVTVYIGSMSNAIQQRCGFYDIIHENEPQLFQKLVKHERGFRDYVSAVDYGDDMISSVDKRIDCFNHISFGNYLSKYGMVFTMPDKKSTPTPFMRFSETDFLKRKSKKVEGTDQWIGALDKGSIFKSLHAVLYSSAITMKDQCAQNIDGALREMWCHGREDYEELRVQLREVAERHELVHRCLRLDVTWDQAFDEYRERYFGEDRELPDEVLPDLEEQSAIENPKEYAVHKYEWRAQNKDTEAKAKESDRPLIDTDKFYIVRRSRAWRRMAGHTIQESDKWLIISRKKDNYIDLIHEIGVKPCFYEDNIYFQDQLVGDIDLGFLLKEDLFIFELKKGRKRSPYANAQAKLMLFHMAQLNPGRRIHSFTVRGDIITHVWSNCELTKRQRKMKFFT